MFSKLIKVNVRSLSFGFETDRLNIWNLVTCSENYLEIKLTFEVKIEKTLTACIIGALGLAT